MVEEEAESDTRYNDIMGGLTHWSSLCRLKLGFRGPLAKTPWIEMMYLFLATNFSCLDMYVCDMCDMCGSILNHRKATRVSLIMWSNKAKTFNKGPAPLKCNMDTKDNHISRESPVPSHHFKYLLVKVLKGQLYQERSFEVIFVSSVVCNALSRVLQLESQGVKKTSPFFFQVLLSTLPELT